MAGMTKLQVFLLHVTEILSCVWYTSSNADTLQMDADL